MRLCVLGDFNLPNFNWDLFTYPHNFLYCSAADFVCNHGLTQLVNDPTRDDAILDLIMCTDVLCCDDVCVSPPLATSDHCTVSFTLSISLPSTQSSLVCNARPNFSKADWPGLCNFLESINWLTEFAHCRSPNQYWNSFLNVIGRGIDEFVPCYVSTKHTVSGKLYPSHIRKLLSRKHSCWKLYRQFRTNQLYCKYKHVSSLCTKAINDHINSIESNQ